MQATQQGTQLAPAHQHPPPALPITQLCLIVYNKDNVRSGQQTVSGWQQDLIQPAEGISLRFLYEVISVLSEGNPGAGGSKLGMVAIQPEHIAAFKQQQQQIKSMKLQRLSDELTALATQRFDETGSSAVPLATLNGPHQTDFSRALGGYMFNPPSPEQATSFVNMLENNGVYAFLAPFVYGNGGQQRVRWTPEGWWVAASSEAATDCISTQQQLYRDFVASAHMQLQTLARSVQAKVATGPCSVYTLIPQQSGDTGLDKMRTLLDMRSKQLLPEAYTMFEMGDYGREVSMMVADGLAAANACLAAAGRPSIQQGVGVLSGVSAAAAAAAAAGAVVAGPSSSSGVRSTRSRARAEAAAASEAVEPEGDKENVPPRPRKCAKIDYPALTQEMMRHLESLPDKASSVLDAVQAVGITANKDTAQAYIKGMQQKGNAVFVVLKGKAGRPGRPAVVGLTQEACQAVSDRLTSMR